MEKRTEDIFKKAETSREIGEDREDFLRKSKESREKSKEGTKKMLSDMDFYSGILGLGTLYSKRTT